jgi:antitoxin component HigA of HigAB toxin-antitoxin module
MNDIEQLITNGNEYNDIIDIVEKYIENNPE